MSKFTQQNAQETTLGGLVSQLKDGLTTSGATLTTREVANQLVSVEGLNDAELSNLTHTYAEVENVVKDHFAQAGISTESISSEGLEAATIAAMAGKDPVAYSKQALTTANPSVEGVTVVAPDLIGGAGKLNHTLSHSVESFDEKSFGGFVSHSVAFNGLAATQDRFCEAHFPTVVLTPDEPGLEVTVHRTMIRNEMKRSLKGDAADLGKVPLINAVRDASILERNDNKIVPAVLADESNSDKFVSKDVYPYKDIEVGGVAVTTGPLAMGKDIDLLGISMDAGTVKGQIGDSTDTIDERVMLGSLVLLVENADGSVKSTIEYPLEGQPHSRFVHDSGDVDSTSELHLNFRSDDIILGSTTKDIANAVPEALPANVVSGANTVRYSVRVNGVVHIEEGNIELNVTKCALHSIVNGAGERIVTGTGTGKDIAEALNVTVVGYFPEATRSNANHRIQGILGDSDSRTQRYTVPVLAPISARRPTDADKTASDLTQLINITRTQIMNNAVTTILNYRDQLSRQVAVARESGSVPAVGGMGRWLVKPYYNEIALDVRTEVDYEKTHEKRQDLEHLLIDAVRDMASKMLVDSEYRAALKADDAGTQTKPKVLIATDPKTAQYLIISGDERILSNEFDFEIVTTDDTRYEGLITMTFVRGVSGKVDPRSFGNHAYMSELVREVTKTVGGATYDALTVQPRSYHICNLPVMSVITVAGIEELMRGSTK